jgi:NAD(P)-dependent dehydrogenase (short-subunit alcohol dehydrogenase family)
VELEGRHVVITGAASGIGRACAVRFAAEGARVVVSDLDAAGAAEVAAQIDGYAFAADVGRESDIASLVAAAREWGGPIDLFFSNAGVPGPPGGPDAPDAELELAWRVNVMSHVWAARAVLPAMVDRGEGYLLSTASAAGLLAEVSALGYTITKHAAVSVAEWLSINYGDAGVRVSCLCPQGVRTPMLALALENPVAAVPLLAGGVLEPDDVAEAVVEGIRAERFLILPHPEVARFTALRAADPDRWLAGMRRMVRAAREGS